MKRSLLYLVLALASIGTAAAQQPAADPTIGSQPRQRIQLDVNNDGVIDRSEAAKLPRLAERFDQLDRNKDGKLSADERPQRRGGHGRGGAQIMQADSDHDGRVSRAEAAANPKLAERFAEMDANRDGFVDRNERELYKRAHQQVWFDEADSNKDGKLSKAEVEASDAQRHAKSEQTWQARRGERFQRLDRTGDGSITRDELEASAQVQH